MFSSFEKPKGGLALILELDDTRPNSHNWKFINIQEGVFARVGKQFDFNKHFLHHCMASEKFTDARKNIVLLVSGVEPSICEQERTAVVGELISLRQAVTTGGPPFVAILGTQLKHQPIGMVKKTLRGILPLGGIRNITMFGTSGFEIIADQRVVHITKRILRLIGLNVSDNMHPQVMVDSNGNVVEDAAQVQKLRKGALRRWRRARSSCRNRAVREWYDTQILESRMRIKKCEEQQRREGSS